jgi:hypothetical protein
LGNGRGNDSGGVRWLIGEDLSGGAIRNMRDPAAMYDPDRLGSLWYVPPVQTPGEGNDWGYVHRNSGINNKLCSLLTDGDTFNAQAISGIGISRVADLYYEANCNLLLSSTDFQDLAVALRQAAINLGWSDADRINLYRVCVAVEIAGVYVDTANTCGTPEGGRLCTLENGGPFRTVAAGVAAAAPGEILLIRNGAYNEPMTINKQLEVRAYDGPATIGQ